MARQERPHLATVALSDVADKALLLVAATLAGLIALVGCAYMYRVRSTREVDGLDDEAGDGGAARESEREQAIARREVVLRRAPRTRHGGAWPGGQS